MMSQEVDDVLVLHEKTIGCSSFASPTLLYACPGGHTSKAAYHEDKGEAREYLRCALVARHAAGYFDCSTCPERLIFNFLWLDTGRHLADSKEPSNPFAGRWTYAESNEPEKWRELTHVDIWSVAQVVQEERSRR